MSPWWNGRHFPAARCAANSFPPPPCLSWKRAAWRRLFGGRGTAGDAAGRFMPAIHAAAPAKGPGGAPWARASRPAAARCRRGGGRQALSTLELELLQRVGDGFACLLSDDRDKGPYVIAACGSWNARGLFASHRQPAPSDLFAFKAHFTVGAAAGPDAAAGVSRRLWRPGGKRQGPHVTVLLHPARCSGRCSRPPPRQGGRGGTGPYRTTTRCAPSRSAPCHSGGTFPLHRAYSSGNPGAARGRRLLRGQYRRRSPSGDRRRHQHGDPVIGFAGAAVDCAVRGEDYARAWRRRFAPRITAASLFAHLAMHHRTTRTAALGLLKTAPSLIGWGARLAGKAPPVLAPSA